MTETFEPAPEESIEPVITPPAEPVRDSASLIKGVVYGLIAATIGGTFLAFSRAGMTQSGLGTPEIAFLRVGVAGLVFLPWFALNWRRCREQLVFSDVLVYVVLIGPPFVVIGIGGYHFAPLVHGAVFLPGSLLIFGTAISALFLGERVDSVMKVSVGVICLGFILIAAPGFVTTGPQVLVGDAMFLWAGAQWSLFAVLVSRRRTDPLVAVAGLSILSLILYCPLYLVMFGIETFTAVSAGTLVTNALIHGLMAGAIAVSSYSLCIGHLGSTRAAFFPALVPVMTLVIGIPLTGEWLTATEWIAVVVIAGGLLASVRAWERLNDIRFGWARLTNRKVTNRKARA